MKTLNDLLGILRTLAIMILGYLIIITAALVVGVILLLIRSILPAP